MCGTCIALLIAGTLVSAAPSWAHIHTGLYTHGSGCPSDRKDPINFVFYNWGTVDRAVSNSIQHAGWANYYTGSSQKFVDLGHGGCYWNYTQLASGGYSSRFHIRFHPFHWDNTYGWTTVGDAHHEDLVWFPTPCGHAVDANGSNGSGFDWGRRTLRIALENAGHAWNGHHWGNTQNLHQCDNDWARSDGWVVWSNTHQQFHGVRGQSR